MFRSTFCACHVLAVVQCLLKRALTQLTIKSKLTRLQIHFPIFFVNNFTFFWTCVCFVFVCNHLESFAPLYYFYLTFYFHAENLRTKTNIQKLEPRIFYVNLHTRTFAVLLFYYRCCKRGKESKFDVFVLSVTSIHYGSIKIFDSHLKLHVIFLVRSQLEHLLL